VAAAIGVPVGVANSNGDESESVKGCPTESGTLAELKSKQIVLN
jgi:hypothetical protein